MNIKNKVAVKHTYSTPQIEIVKLDNDISLSLESDPSPAGEPTWVQNQDSFRDDPFKSQIC